MLKKLLIIPFCVYILTAQAMKVYDSPGLGKYNLPFYPNGIYDEKIQSPSAFFGFELGARPVRHHEAKSYFEYLDKAAENASLFHYGKTYENRDLFYLIITSKQNFTALEKIKTNIGKLADPRTMTKNDDGNKIIDQSPAVAWMAYGIHGDEISSTDAALQLAYQLIAGTDDKTKMIRENMIIAIDPMQNPDGRERILAQYQQWQGVVTNTDAQSLNHTGVWPWGRTNHYLFDLNRDWFATVHPETRGKVKAIMEWNPQLVVDAHEMGDYDTYLFDPPREPFNPFYPSVIHKWWKLFTQDQAKSFDHYGWNYYTREWNEEIYPGYGSSWGIYAGLVAILYEQSGTSGQVVKRPDGTETSFREAVHHQFVSSLSNLTTAAQHRKELLKDFYEIRKQNVDSNPTEAFVFPITANTDRLTEFAKTLQRQNIEVHVVTGEIKLPTAKSRENNEVTNLNIPGGAFIVKLNQPLRSLIQNILHFDIRFDSKSMEKERNSILKNEGSTLYDVTAWSLPLAFGLEGYYTAKLPKLNLNLYAPPTETGKVINPNPDYGFILDGSKDGIIIAIARLLENQIKLFAIKEEVSIEGKTFTAGSILIRKQSNPDLNLSLLELIASASGLDMIGINTALAQTGPDLGGSKVNLLLEPKIALLGGEFMGTSSFGSIWHLLDSRIQYRNTLLNSVNFSAVDLRKYNVLIFPSSGVNALKHALGDEELKNIKDWVHHGGTLIAIGGSAQFLADSSSSISATRNKEDILKDLKSYSSYLQEHDTAFRTKVDSLALWESAKTTVESSKVKDEFILEELKNKDELGKKLSPQGAILRVNLNKEHWLNYGCGEMVPVMYNSSSVLMAKDPNHTSARFADEHELRLGGLLWPEARERLALGSWTTREQVGKGQVILFATEPNFRGFFRGSERLLLNAIFYGPGLGTDAGVEW